VRISCTHSLPLVGTGTHSGRTRKSYHHDFLRRLYVPNNFTKRHAACLIRISFLIFFEHHVNFNYCASSSDFDTHFMRSCACYEPLKIIYDTQVISIVLNILEIRSKIKQLKTTDMWVNEMSNKILSHNIMHAR
jgi:hypothetical protein